MKTTAQVAKLYGITAGRVCRIAKARSIVGEKLMGNWLWSDEQVVLLKPGNVGRPRKERSQ